MGREVQNENSRSGLTNFRLHNDQFLQKVDHAKQKINQTIEQVYTFDYQTTGMLTPIEQNIQQMQTYIQDIQSRF
ncbi:T7SS effector LXG polymorphic toxin [Cytobacillus sp. Hz8]|uniref:T7SS effector LXG polymorphic toxin n=1 Tax=Cytobacillus sp. Hz8 TaxID=3347168 RepID=UPI0035DF8AED